MKTINFKSVLQTLVFCAIFVSSVIVSNTIYQEVKQLYRSQPAGAGISCLFDMMY